MLDVLVVDIELRCILFIPVITVGNSFWMSSSIHMLKSWRRFLTTGSLNEMATGGSLSSSSSTHMLKSWRRFLTTGSLNEMATGGSMSSSSTHMLKSWRRFLTTGSLKETAMGLLSGSSNSWISSMSSWSRPSALESQQSSQVLWAPDSSMSQYVSKD